MRFLRRRPPTWSDGLTADAADEIKNALLSSLSGGESVDWESWPEGAIIRRDHGLEVRYALARVAELYRMDQGDRSVLLADYFAAMGATGLEPPEDWDSAKEMLLAKVYSDQSFDDGQAGEFVHAAIARGLIAILQIEMSNAFHGVSRASAASWGVTDDELWQAARANIHHRVPVTEELWNVNDGCEVRVLHNQHRLVTSHILELANHLDGTVEGAIVGIPHENLVLVHEVRDESADGALGYILATTPEMFESSPTTGISQHTYWWRDGTLMPLTDSDGKYLRYSPPADFDALMRRLVSGA